MSICSKLRQMQRVLFWDLFLYHWRYTFDSILFNCALYFNPMHYGLLPIIAPLYDNEPHGPKLIIHMYSNYIVAKWSLLISHFIIQFLNYVLVRSRFLFLQCRVGKCCKRNKELGLSCLRAHKPAHILQFRLFPVCVNRGSVSPMTLYVSAGLWAAITAGWAFIKES